MAAVKNMNRHPDIFMLKELHYFDLGWHSGSPEQYRATFKEALQREQPHKLLAYQSGQLLIGEKTPEYIYVDECAVRIKQVLGSNKKFIFFIRDPIQRAFSAWNMITSKHRETESFEDCVDRNLLNLNEMRSYGTAEYHYVQRGFYLDQIERFLKVFPNKENLLIVVSERIQKDPATEYQRIFKFLGVNSDFKFEAEDEHKGVYKTTMKERTKQKLLKIFTPHNERLFQFLGYRIPEWYGCNDDNATVVVDEAVDNKEVERVVKVEKNSKSESIHHDKILASDG
mmetsp:Transcript_29805/g.40943  ORF Transcript_29805/g.40943 Transcript_29805/m.40943 type:complete len:284 (-) Transcript_29805:115-966(-)